MAELRLRPEALVWREIDNELVAVDMASSTYLSANRSGALLWQMLATGTTHAELVEQLIDRFGIPADRATSDVDAFLRGLEGRELLAK
jgi:Coenzyme PQQ synthesis protein D (PqqD)